MPQPRLIRHTRLHRHPLPIPPEVEDYFSDHDPPTARLKSAANRRRSWEAPAPPTLAEILAARD